MFDPRMVSRPPRLHPLHPRARSQTADQEPRRNLRDETHLGPTWAQRVPPASTRGLPGLPRGGGARLSSQSFTGPPIWGSRGREFKSRQPDEEKWLTRGVGELTRLEVIPERPPSQWRKPPRG